MGNIHPTAVVSPQALIDPTAVIGPFCVVGDHVKIKADVVLKSHVCIDGHTVIGEGTMVYPFACLGYAPQDLKYSGEPSRLIIGKNNKIREYVTMHPGTEGDNMQTVIGDNCLFMVSSHVAHDCIIGNNVILANNATLGGHVKVGNHAIIGGLSAVHQFVRIGAHSIVGGMSGVAEDLIPFGKAVADRAVLAGLNVIGLKRRAFDHKTIHNLRNVYAQLFESDEDTFEVRVNAVKEKYIGEEAIQEVIVFLQEGSNRSFCFPKKQERE